MTTLGAAENPYFRLASDQQIQGVVNQALSVWEHPKLQEHLFPGVWCQELTTGFQAIGSTSVSLTFGIPSSVYPHITIETEETVLDGASPEDEIILISNFSFRSVKRPFGRYRYTATALDKLSLVNIELPHDRESNIPPPEPNSWLSADQLAAIEKGRRLTDSNVTVYQAGKLANLLFEFDPEALADIGVDVGAAE